jgi:hypothetical protein
VPAQAKYRPILTNSTERKFVMLNRTPGSTLLIIFALFTSANYVNECSAQITTKYIPGIPANGWTPYTIKVTGAYAALPIRTTAYAVTYPMGQRTLIPYGKVVVLTAQISPPPANTYMFHQGVGTLPTGGGTYCLETDFLDPVTNKWLPLFRQDVNP